MWGRARPALGQIVERLQRHRDRERLEQAVGPPGIEIHVTELVSELEGEAGIAAIEYGEPDAVLSGLGRGVGDRTAGADEADEGAAARRRIGAKTRRDDLQDFASHDQEIAADVRRKARIERHARRRRGRSAEHQQGHDETTKSHERPFRAEPGWPRPCSAASRLVVLGPSRPSTPTPRVLPGSRAHQPSRRSRAAGI
jgi:hypothetical protein